MVAGRRRRVAPFALLCALVVVLALPATAPATAPGANGRIAFAGTPPGGTNSAIGTVAPDGTDYRLFADNCGASGCADAYRPAWSPDGSKLAWSNARQLFVQNADGTGRVSSANATVGGRDALVTADGREVFAYDAAWSPDGSRMAFTGCIPMQCWIYVVPATGWPIAPALIAPLADSGDAQGGMGISWGRDGRIAYPALRPRVLDGLDNSDQTIAAIDPDTGARTALTWANDASLPPDAWVAEGSPEWSPDGTLLAFTRQIYAPRSDPPPPRVHVLEPATSTAVAVGGAPGPQDNVTWSPDCTRLAYDYNDRAGHYGLRTMRVDGTDEVVLPAADKGSDASWQPLPGPAVSCSAPPPPSDTTAPEITIFEPREGAVYVLGDDRYADYFCQDEAGGSDVATCDGTVGSGQALDTATVGDKVFAVTATDLAGNSRTATRHYSVVASLPDTSAPAVWIDSPRDGAKYAVGDVATAAYQCYEDDGGSGLASCTGPVADGARIDTSRAGHFTFAVTGTDNAGNAETQTHTYDVVGDTTAPEIVLDSPPQSGLYFVGDRLAVSFTCRDDGWPSTGLASCVGTPPAGTLLDTATPGQRSVSVTATDWAGNTRTVTHSYRVLARLTPGTDTDGDGLLDSWETSGIDADGNGTIDLRLDQAPYSADPRHKDVFVETDYMDCGVAPGRCDPGDTRSFAPVAGVLSDVTAAFAAAPVANPDGTTGIRLHAMLGDALPAYPLVRFYDPQVRADISWDELKSGGGAPCDGGFGTAAERAAANCAEVLLAKRLAVHYAIFGRRYAEIPGSSGYAELPGNDFIVSVGEWSMQDLGGRRPVEAATFMHELGHNLALRHGGRDENNCKPNYLSVMNYALTFPDIDPRWKLDYSRSALATLNEAGLSEPAGIGGPAGRSVVFGYRGVARGSAADAPVDWNGNGAPLDLGVAADVNWIPSAGCDGAGTTLAGSNDWSGLTYDFRAGGNFSDGVHARPPVELTEQQVTQTARTADFDGDGVRNLDDTCAVDTPANDIDGDGTPDGCDAASEARIDVDPTSTTNTIKLSSTLPVPVVILSGPKFAAPKRVDRASLTFGRTGGEASAAGCLTTAPDVNGDGRPDLVCGFAAARTGLRVGDTAAVLKGRTVGGARFTGRDAVRVVK